jgi:hypothetical protein
MKKYLLYYLALGAPLWLAAQEPRPTRRPSPPPKTEKPEAGHPTPKAHPEKGAPERPEGTGQDPAWRKAKKPIPPDPLSEDVVFHVKGSFQGRFDLDLKLPAGRGPTFVINNKTMSGEGPVEERPPIVGIRATVSELDGGYRVDYRIGARVTVATEAPEQAEGARKLLRNIEFRDVIIEGGVLVKPGEAVVINKIQDKELSLTLSKSTAKPAQEREGAKMDAGGKK